MAESTGETGNLHSRSSLVEMKMTLMDSSFQDAYRTTPEQLIDFADEMFQNVLSLDTVDENEHQDNSSTIPTEIDRTVFSKGRIEPFTEHFGIFDVTDRKSKEKPEGNQKNFGKGVSQYWMTMDSHVKWPIHAITNNRLEDKRIHLKYNPRAKNNRFLWTRKPHSELKSYVEGVVEVTDPVLPATQEEFLHAAEEIMRQTVFEQPEAHLIRATRDAVHSSIVLDLILTRAAVEMGPEEYLYWFNRAHEQTTRDHSNISSDREGTTILGTEVNERFHYPHVSVQEIELIVGNHGKYIDAKWFRSDGSTNDNVVAIDELVMLAYGRDDFEYIMRILEAGTSIADPEKFSKKSNQIITGVYEVNDVGIQAIEIGKQILRYAKGTPLEADIVRHQKPLNQQVNQLSVSYEISEQLKQNIQNFIDADVPVTLTYGDFEIEGLTNLADSLVEIIHSENFLKKKRRVKRG